MPHFTSVSAMSDLTITLSHSI